jgi:wobble nucleotide-excising tRNase
VISRVQLLRNIGKFDSVATTASVALERLSLVYAENGRGKTTLTAILRSLQTGDPVPIAERRRLAAADDPHIVIECAGGPPPAVFQNNAWNRHLPDILIFDEIFVDQNVCSGLEVESNHRQKLHELILGSQAVTLARELHQHAKAIETHSADLRARAGAIPASVRGPFGVDEFCAISTEREVDTAIEETERILAAAGEQDPIRLAPAFELLDIPVFDMDEIESLLRRDLAGLDSAAAARVHAHVAGIGTGGEDWVSQGLERIDYSESNATCPFCAQALTNAPIIQQYRAYFSEAYRALKQDIAQAIRKVNRLHSDETPAAFERALRHCTERRQFWSRFCDVPDISVDTADIGTAWRDTRQTVLAALEAKQAAPLEQIADCAIIRAAHASFNIKCDSIRELNERLK